MAINHPLATHARRHWRYLLCLLAVLLWAATQTGGIFVAGLALGLALPYALWRAARLLWARPRPALEQALAPLLLWALVGAAVWGIAQWHEKQARLRADAVAAAIGQWQQAQGHWPPDLSAAGLPAPASAFDAHYRLQAGQPALFYRSPWLAFDTWVYDFETRQWRYAPD